MNTAHCLRPTPLAAPAAVAALLASLLVPTPAEALPCGIYPPQGHVRDLCTHAYAFARDDSGGMAGGHDHGISHAYRSASVGTRDAWATATSQYGFNHAAAGASGPSQHGMQSAWAESVYWETWSISVPNAAPNTSYTGRVGLTVSGFVQTGQDGSASMDYALILDPEDNTSIGEQQVITYDGLWIDGQPDPDPFLPAITSFSFYPDEPIPIVSRLGVGVSTNGHVNFAHTIALTYLELPPGAVLTSASGTVYPVTYTPPPPPHTIGEPSLPALLAAGIAGMLGCRRRRRRGASAAAGR